MGIHCRHGQEHNYHHHHHVGLAEGITPIYVKKLQWVLALAILYLVAQALGAFFSGSLALLADAGHKLADVGSISLALIASWFSHLASSPKKTFGYYRLEIIAALMNGLTLILMALYILWEAYERLSRHEAVHIEGGIMLAVAGVGLLINLVSAKLLYPVKELNLNVKGALFHIMADIADSLGTMLTAGAIMLFQVTWLDSLMSVLIASLVLYNACRIFRDAFHILMEAAPGHLHLPTVEQFIRQRSGVLDVHDLHVWTITTGKDALLAHVKVTQEAFRHEIARALEKDLREQFELCHITIQLEPPDFVEEAIPF
jgi:cobalt-zinc-cadmium efflux system protein